MQISPPSSRRHLVPPMRSRQHTVVLGMGMVAMCLLVLLSSVSSANRSRLVAGIAQKTESEVENHLKKHDGTEAEMLSFSATANAIANEVDIRLEHDKREEKTFVGTSDALSESRQEKEPQQQQAQALETTTKPNGEEGETIAESYDALPDPEKHQEPQQTQQQALLETATQLKAGKLHPPSNKKACYHAKANAKMEFILKKLAKYVPVNTTISNSTQEAKPCFLSELHNQTRSCTANNNNNWKFVLDTPTIALENGTWVHGNLVCDLEAYAQQDMGGPRGLAHLLLGARPTQRIKPVYNVVLMGGSDIQRVWESLVCQWSEEITQIALQLNQEGQTAGEHNQTAINILHTNWTRAQNLGCRVDGTTAANRCNDNVSMVEFAETIRFYFLAHPHQYEKHQLQQITDAVGLDVRAINQLVLGQQGQSKNQKAIRHWQKHLPTGVWNNGAQWNSKHFDRLRERDTAQQQQQPTFCSRSKDEANFLWLVLLKQKVYERPDHRQKYGVLKPSWNGE